MNEQEIKCPCCNGTKQVWIINPKILRGWHPCKRCKGTGLITVDMDRKEHTPSSCMGLLARVQVWNGQLLAHPFHMAIYELMWEIEKLPASEQETKVVIMADALQNRVAEMRAEASKQAKCLREQSAECFPEENGQKHFARLIMEGVADELDAAFNPPISVLGRSNTLK